MLKKYSTELKAALGFMILQFLFKITFELDGGSKIQNIPIMHIVFFVLPMLIIAFILSLFKQRSAYILGMIYSFIHIPLVTLLMIVKEIPEGYSYLRPINVIVTCIFIAYFCYLEYKKTGQNKNEVPFYNTFMVSLYLILSWICLLITGAFTDILKRNNVGARAVESLSTPNMQIIIIIAFVITVLLVVFTLLKKEWSYLLTGFYAIILFILLILFAFNAKALLFIVLGILFSIMLIIYSFLVFINARKNKLFTEG